jgi:hypothetical protein
VGVAKSRNCDTKSEPKKEEEEERRSTSSECFIKSSYYPSSRLDQERRIDRESERRGSRSCEISQREAVKEESTLQSKKEED